MILNGDGGAVITFRTDRKIRRNGRSGGHIDLFGAREKVSRILFLKRRWLADNDSVPFRYIRDT